MKKSQNQNGFLEPKFDHKSLRAQTFLELLEIAAMQGNKPFANELIFKNQIQGGRKILVLQPANSR